MAEYQALKREELIDVLKAAYTLIKKDPSYQPTNEEAKDGRDVMLQGLRECMEIIDNVGINQHDCSVTYAIGRSVMTMADGDPSKIRKINVICDGDEEEEDNTNPPPYERTARPPRRK